MSRRILSLLLCLGLGSFCGVAQEMTPPVPQRLVIHSKILNEDRTIWVRMPAAAQGKQESYAVIYATDAGGNVNEIGSTVDFLADNNLMPPLILVAIANTDRNRDLTPTHADVKHSDGTVDPIPTSGGADKFLDFMQTELMPEIEKRYRTEPYRIIVGHSLGGLFAVHALFARPELFQAGIVSSPSLWWDDFWVLREVEDVLSKRKAFKKTLFFSLGNEKGNMDTGFTRLQKIVDTYKPKDFVVRSAHYLDEEHTSTELVTHYAALRLIFRGWQIQRDPKTGDFIGGLAGVESHYRELSERLGFNVSQEKAINRLGYSLLGDKKVKEAVAAFQRNVELYPRSANVYDSLGEALEANDQPELALENVRKAVAIATETGDPLLPEIQKHMDKLMADAKVRSEKSGKKQ
jgi:predicted alpha/beta superfamily hydrolase